MMLVLIHHGRHNHEANQGTEMTAIANSSGISVHPGTTIRAMGAAAAMSPPRAGLRLPWVSRP